MPSSGVIDLAIGLTFVFGATAALASVVTELIARLTGLRGAYLLTGLRELVDGSGATTDLASAEADYRDMQGLVRGAAARAQPPAARPAAGRPRSALRRRLQPQPPDVAPQGVAPAPPVPPAAPPATASLSATGALLGSPILSSQGMTGLISSRKITLAPAKKAGGLPTMTADRTAGSLWSQRRSLPSYISSRSFADAVIDLVVPDAAGQTTMTTISRNIGALPPQLPLKSSLQALASSAGTDVSRFRTGVEHWYDDHMDRVSGWYKRYVAKITLVIGAVLVLLLNINALTIGRTLYTESTVSTALSTVAVKGADCPASQTRQDCLAALQAELSAAATAGLPIGWGTVRDCTAGARCNWLDQRGIFSRQGNSGWQLVLVLAGFLIMIVALVPGARFWFGLLSKLGTLRAAGPKPAADAS